MIAACDWTCGMTGCRLGSAPRKADLACGGDIVAAARIAFSASTVPCPEPLSIPLAGLYTVPWVMAVVTWAADRSGNCPLIRAAIPATIAPAAHVLFIVR